MDKIKIITDSTADLPKNIVEKYKIEVLPLLVTFGEETYIDGIDINTSTLLKKMESSEEFPGTAQVNPQRFLECYKNYISEGYKIISIHLSSKMSGTYQSACIARDMLQTDCIRIIDSLNVTSGLGLLVLKAARLNEEGLSVDKIEEEILKAIPHVKSVLAFEYLDNLVKGGRLSRTAGIIGNILGIKPILAVDNGEMVVIDKVRGSKKAIRYIMDYLDKVGIKDNEPSILLHIDNKDILDNLRENLKEKQHEFIECEVGCVVGVHAGKNACGVFFIENY
ncbi:DegV family protein with EDD domain [Clostridium tetanomorphum]|uniref:DegV family protein n=1 Tax=Clostridium tetanomorphum TaxID=1553 RepID=A0A923EDM9_CLOTT|nr:DegV family protein [Clostridium tetanomorphum]KAJ50402.1 degV protein [Clostridium tetanomorphum DSM 665]MBC2398703.1 DegV family protein [Clostridium tetanomorphum]MBP1865784.1 DegV family protein with EDD domain [Clostridium tetanomorphum]NRS86905.1 DegV family protein with EDD domain [Clostridium tetanomorphum]NRZ99337.1 DegV family protein with EDD domain [Clostridium tetanomorphum]